MWANKFIFIWLKYTTFLNCEQTKNQPVNPLNKPGHVDKTNLLVNINPLIFKNMNEIKALIDLEEAIENAKTFKKRAGILEDAYYQVLHGPDTSAEYGLNIANLLEKWGKTTEQSFIPHANKLRDLLQSLIEIGNAFEEIKILADRISSKIDGTISRINDEIENSILVDQAFRSPHKNIEA